jgi:hypothetical protein
LLLVDVGADVIIILIHCSKKWLLSYVPSCHENLKITFTSSPPNGTIIGLPTRSLYTNMELEPLFFVSWRPQIAQKKFGLCLFMFLNYSLSPFVHNSN